MENFVIRRDGEISHWETYKPQVKHDLRRIGASIWTRANEIVDEIGEEWPTFMPSR